MCVMREIVETRTHTHTHTHTHTYTHVHMYTRIYIYDNVISVYYIAYVRNALHAYHCWLRTRSKIVVFLCDAFSVIQVASDTHVEKEKRERVCLCKVIRMHDKETNAQTHTHTYTHIHTPPT